MRKADAIALGLVLLAVACERQAPKPGPSLLAVETAWMPEISHVEIPVTDMDRAVDFYQAVFGVALERAVIDGYDIALFPEPDGAGATVALAKGDVYRPSTEGAIVYFRVADIDGVLARATAGGGAVLYPKKDIGELGHVAEIRDSEGNRIALSQPRG